MPAAGGAGGPARPGRAAGPDPAAPDPRPAPRPRGAADAENAWQAGQVGAAAQPTCPRRGRSGPGHPADQRRRPTSGGPGSGPGRGTGPGGGRGPRLAAARSAVGPRGQPQAAGDGSPGWLAGRAAHGYACDAQPSPRSSPATLTPPRSPRLTAESAAPPLRPAPLPARGRPPAGPAPGSRTPCCGTPPTCSPAPAGLAAFLRTGLLAADFPRSACRWTPARRPAPCPPHLRRAVIARDRRCAFPGCPPAARALPGPPPHAPPAPAAGPPCPT